MEQSRIESIIESVINIGSGFVVALLLWVYVVSPIWGFKVSMAENLTITSMFTVVSIARSYFWRRFFNAGLHKTIHKIVGEYLHGAREKI